MPAPDSLDLPDISRGDPIPGDWLTQLKNATAQLLQDYSANFNNSLPLLFQHQGRAATIEHRVGRIAAKPSNPPISISNTDAQYYVTLQVATGAAPATFSNLKVVGSVGSRGTPGGWVDGVVVATNLHEWQNGTKLDGDGNAVGVDTHLLQVNDVVHVFAVFLASDPTNKLYFFSRTPNDGLFRVNLTQHGGASGTDPNPPAAGVICDYTYDVYDLSGNKIDTYVAVEKDRLFPVKMTAATKGIAYFDPISGDVKIWDCNEVPDSASCS